VFSFVGCVALLVLVDRMLDTFDLALVPYLALSLRLAVTLRQVLAALRVLDLLVCVPLLLPSRHQH
jgi:hypothetical protein